MSDDEERDTPLDKYRRDGHHYGLTITTLRAAAADARATEEERVFLTKKADTRMADAQQIATRIRAR